VPARQIVSELRPENLQATSLISELPRGQRLDFCFNLLGSIINHDVTLALENLSRDEALGLIKSRLMSKRYVNRVALEMYVKAPEVSKADFYDVLGLGENKLEGMEPRQAIAEAINQGEEVIYAVKPISPKVIEDVRAMFPERLGEGGSEMLVTFPGAHMPAEIRQFIDGAVNRLIKSGLVEKSELAGFVKGNLTSKLIVARHPEAEKSDLMKLVVDRSDLISPAAYRNLRARGLVDAEVRTAMVKAKYWWIRRELIKDPEAERGTLEALAARYIERLLRELKNEVKRGLVPKMRDTKLVPKAKEMSSLDFLLIILIPMEQTLLSSYGEATDLVKRLHPNFEQVAQHFFDKVATEAEIRDEEHGHIRS
jgi:hypothetical protein